MCVVFRSEGGDLFGQWRSRGPAAGARSSPISRGTPSGRAAVDRETVHVPTSRRNRRVSMAAPRMAQTGFPRARSSSRLSCGRARPIGTITIRRDTPGPLLPTQVTAPRDLRRPSSDRHREREAVQRAAGAHPRAGAVGGGAQGAGRGRPGRQLDARPRHGADDHREPGGGAVGDRRRRDLRVRRGRSGVRVAGDARHDAGADRGGPDRTGPGRGGGGTRSGEPAPGADSRHRGGA